MADLDTLATALDWAMLATVDSATQAMALELVTRATALVWAMLATVDSVTLTVV